MKTANLINNKINIKFTGGETDDFYSTLEKIKSIPGRVYKSQTKSWIVPVSIESVEALKKNNFDISSDILFQYENLLADYESNKKVIKDIKIPENSQLLSFQKEHAKEILSALMSNNSALDGSDTGTGKTYVALFCAKYLKLKPVVITPKSVIPSWKKAAKFFNIDIFVSNYEQFKNGNTDYLSATKTEKEVKLKWNTDEKQIIIFDEIHRCKNYKTINSKMLIAAEKTKSKVLGLSATIADNPLQMYALGLTLNLFPNWNGFWQWAFKRGVKKGYFGMEFISSIENLKKIHGDVYTEKGNRIAIKDLGDQFPDNLVIAEPYAMDNSDKIQSVYNTMKAELYKLKKTKENDGETNALTERLRARQEIELLKIPTLVQLAEDLIEEGNAVPIFVNFKETIKILSEKLKTNCIIDGSILDEEREKNITDFQSDKERIILCNIQAGGVGISLHDLNGNHPRVSLISPTDSAQNLVQTLGRTPRAGALTPVVQKIIYCADTVEEKIAQNVSDKIDNIKTINDGDLGESLLKLKEV